MKKLIREHTAIIPEGVVHIKLWDDGTADSILLDVKNPETPFEKMFRENMINSGMDPDMIRFATKAVDMQVGDSPEEQKKTLAEKAKEFASAQMDILKNGRVSEEVANYRLTVCTGLDKNNKRVSTACTHYDDQGDYRGSGFCKGCQCPAWKGARMDNPGSITMPGKVWYPLECPQAKFASMPGRRAK